MLGAALSRNNGQEEEEAVRHLWAEWESCSCGAMLPSWATGYQPTLNLLWTK